MDWMKSADLIGASTEVSDALGLAGGVVALESVAFAHGFERDEGCELLLACFDVIRAAGSVPAVAYVDKGRITLESRESAILEFFSRENIRKVGPRDLSDALVRQQPGGLTIGGTLAVAAIAGIRVMSAGGLGGVHFGFASSLDISSDLHQLAAASVVLVSAGIKPVLDVAASAEVLETLSVPMLGWQTDEVPIFYRRGGGPPVSSRVETVAEVVAMATKHWALGMGGLLLLRPPDREIEIEDALRSGLAEVERLGVRGQDVTPFLLRWLDVETDAKTVEPHKQLLVENARLAGEVACALL
jgi:pseudouridine-5'-phosphate glycosidase